MEFLSIEHAAERISVPHETGSETPKLLSDFLANIKKPVGDLNEAREAMGWTQSEFAYRLDVPARAFRYLSRGEITDALQQSELISRIEEALGRPHEQVRHLIQSATMPVPDHFKSTGTPQQLNSQPKTWIEALLECQKRGELTAQQAATWLPKKKKR